MNYLIVVPVPCYPISETSFATESAFAEHLRQLWQMWAKRFDRIVIAAPAMSRDVFEQHRDSIGILDSGAVQINLVPMHPTPIGFGRYWLRHLAPNILKLRRAIKDAGVVHSGPSHLYYPFGCVALLMAAAARKPTIYIQDIDQRRSSWMNYRTGRWSLKSYLLAKTVYDPVLFLQTWLAVRACSLVLLKGQKLCEDFGRGNPRVKNFIDSAFSAEHIIPPAELEKKIAGLQDCRRPLEVVYFGRLAAYKGLDRSLEAIARVIAVSGPLLRFHIIGAGEEQPLLRALSDRLGIASHVIFHGAMPFGQQLFDRLYQCDLLLATPLSEDTPRNALDAMASGVPILAFDTYYYQDLQRSGAVDVVSWPSVDALADRLTHYVKNKPSLVRAIENGVRFAQSNTQEIWLRRRYEWTLEAIGAGPQHPTT